MQKKFETTIDNMPRTGRIGRFIKILEKQVVETDLLEIAEGSQKYNNLKPKDKALWWKDTVERMEDMLGEKKSVEIMTACGAKCCGMGQRKTAKKMMEQSSSVSEFLQKLSTYEVRDGELEYILADDNTIIARHNRCFCGQVKHSTKLHESDTYCKCSVEFNRQFFMAALGREVKVMLNKSILLGDDCCEFQIDISIPS